MRVDMKLANVQRIWIFCLFLLPFASGYTGTIDEAWGERFDKIQQRVANAIKGKCYVQFSAYQQDKHGLPVDNLDEVAFHGKVKFVIKQDSWRADTYMSPVITNPTWLDVAILANEMIKQTKDTHHVYLEDIEATGKQGEVTILEFVMGS
jgi:hypothetical protein